jgi:NTP pyrophosphatase (non-canonical NTP hydrolase)
MAVTTFDLYQELTRKTAQYPMRGHNLVYPALKLAGESGELADKIGKHWRNESKRTVAFEFNEIVAMGAASLTAEQKLEIIKEMGDVLWYLAALSDELDIQLSSVAEMNINKTHDRLKRGVVCSEGDNR